MSKPVSGDLIEKRIFLIRGHRVMLSTHLAHLYGVETRALVQAVKRNLERFPSDFAFQLSWEEVELLRSHSVILRGEAQGKGQHAKYPPYAFTQEGVAMLSSVLRSERAVQVNIAIMRAFVRVKALLASHKELAAELAQLESRVDRHDREIQTIFEAIHQLIAEPKEEPKKRIGFHP